MKKRVIDIAVLSNIELGSVTCRAEELLTYLGSIEPSVIILIGNTANFSFKHPNNIPVAHLKVLRKLVELSGTKTELICLSDKNDKTINKIAHRLGLNVRICKNLSFSIGANKVKFIKGLDLHLKTSDTQKINNIVQKFEKQDFTHLIIAPNEKSNKVWMETERGKICILQSGDWTKTLSALEYSFKRWKIYKYQEDKLTAFYADEALKAMELNDFYAMAPPLRNQAK